MAKKQATDQASRKPFDSVEAAQAAKPQSEKLRMYRVTDPDGTIRFTWADGGWGAVVNVTRGLGFKASRMDRIPNKNEVAGMVAQLSPEDRAALLAQLSGKKSK
jgi:hypothetical protein